MASNGFASEGSWSRFEGERLISDDAIADAQRQEEASLKAEAKRGRKARSSLRQKDSDGYSSYYQQPRRSYSQLPLSPGSHNVSAEFGQLFMVRDPANAGNAFGSQIRYTQGISQLFGFDSILGYSSHSGGQFRQIHLGGGARINLVRVDRMVSYLSSGLGFYQTSLRNPDGLTRSSNTAFGFYSGVGMDLIVSKSMFFGAAIQFNNAFSGNSAGTYAQLLARMGFTL